VTCLLLETHSHEALNNERHMGENLSIMKNSHTVPNINKFKCLSHSSSLVSLILLHHKWWPAFCCLNYSFLSSFVCHAGNSFSSSIVQRSPKV
jgi:hypothetical protein